VNDALVVHGFSVGYKAEFTYSAHFLSSEQLRKPVEYRDQYGRIPGAVDHSLAVNLETMYSRAFDRCTGLISVCFKIAQKANVPIVILTIRGTETIHKNYPLHTAF